MVLLVRELDLPELPMFHQHQWQQELIGNHMCQCKGKESCGEQEKPPAEDVIRTINSYTSVKTGLPAKRKFKSTPRHPHTTTKWWFVISGEEHLLQQLQGEWTTISNQTEGKWSLEPLLCYCTELTPIGLNPPPS